MVWKVVHIDMRKKRRKIVVSVILTVAAIAAAITVFCAARGERMPRLEINGAVVGREEYLQAVKDVRYDVSIYFGSTYGAREDDGFWTEEYGGEIPYRKLADEALERLKYLHAVYTLAEEKGYINDAGYNAIVERMEAENAERKEKIENGEPVYGLAEYSLDVFIEYETSSFKERYCSDKENERMKLTEEEIVEHYQSREWIFGENDENADLETARVAVERELREKKYDEMIAQRESDSQVKVDGEELYSFTLMNITQ